MSWGGPVGPDRAAALHHVGAVQPGAPDADEHLARPGRRIGVLLDGELLVADRDGVHGGGTYSRSSNATHSMCGVWGNMSTGLTRRSA